VVRAIKYDQELELAHALTDANVNLARNTRPFARDLVIGNHDCVSGEFLLDPRHEFLELFPT